MKATLGQPIVIENIPTAAGTVGVGRLAQAAPDGYTITISEQTSHVISSIVYPVHYDVLNDFDPISLLSTSAATLIARRTMQASDLKQKRIAEVGQEVVPRDQQTPHALAAHHKAELEKWMPMIKPRISRRSEAPGSLW